MGIEWLAGLRGASFYDNYKNQDYDYNKCKCGSKKAVSYNVCYHCYSDKKWKNFIRKKNECVKNR